ncbi:hypothetical protein GALL_327140 [mine drainage metagenome]|uniref:PBP domain-containing protein n=1 Tax=mine drainage metagenome TaxID=410659 RepID=A0A1J5QPD0_9ZZZZ
MRLMLPVRCLLLLLLLWPSLVPAADEAMAVIVAAGHGKNLRKEDLTLIYKRKKLFWSDGSRVQPVNLPASSPFRRAFSQAVLGASPEDLEKYWNDIYFQGVSPPFVLSSEQAVMHFVAETPGAIGYVPICSVGGHVDIALVINASGHVSDDPAAAACSR